MWLKKAGSTLLRRKLKKLTGTGQTLVEQLLVAIALAFITVPRLDYPLTYLD